MKKIQLMGIVELSDTAEEKLFYDKLTKWLASEDIKFTKVDYRCPNHLMMQKADHEAVWDSIELPRSRYSLRKIWKADGNKVTALMMNPSHAGAITSDETVNFMTNYTTRHFNAGALWIVNMSPLINPSSGNLNNFHFNFNQDNLEFIKQALEWANTIFLAWGKKGHIGYNRMKSELLPMLLNQEKQYFCFRQGSQGIPIHKNSWKDSIKINTEPVIFDTSLLS